MAEENETKNPIEDVAEATNEIKSAAMFTIWPPSQKARDAVIERLIETLTAPSVLEKRYGAVDRDEAAAAAAAVEQEAFQAADAAALDADSVDDGIEALQIYTKEIGSRTIEVIKAKGSATKMDQSGDAE